MGKWFFCFFILVGLKAVSQVDSTSTILMNELDKKVIVPEVKKPSPVFYAQRLINANTVEVLPTGRLEFKVVHLFGDVAGDFGGIKNAFGLDNSTDIKIAFLLGLTKNLNLIVSRNKGNGSVLQLWELGFKYKILQQMENDPAHPLSLAVFANAVVSSQKASTDPARENFYTAFSDRQSHVIQLMVARKFGNLFSFQLSPTYVHTNHVVPGDVKNILALGLALRVPIYKKFVFIADYFHSFRSQNSTDALRSQGIRLYDALGVGLELVTPGHVFHVNFTNTTSILENRFIPRTTTSWGKGEYRWGFTVSRDFILFKNKRKK